MAMIDDAKSGGAVAGIVRCDEGFDELDGGVVDGLMIPHGLHAGEIIAESAAPGAEFRENIGAGAKLVASLFAVDSFF